MVKVQAFKFSNEKKQAQKYNLDGERIDETNLAHGELMKPSEIEQRIDALRTTNSESATQDRTERRYPQPRDPHRSQSEVTNPQSKVTNPQPDR